jgi:hypothetical protein
MIRKDLSSIAGSAALAVAAAFTCAPMFAQAAEKAIAWVEPDAVTRQLPLDKYRAFRADREIARDERAALLPCDRVELSVPSATVRFSLANGNAIRLSAIEPKGVIPCSHDGLSAKFEDALRALMGNQSSWRPAGTLSRSAADPIPSLPVFTSERSNVVAGKRSLFVPWSGGKAPFTVRIVSREKGKVVGERRGIRSQSVWFEQIDLPEGRYTLIVEPEGATPQAKGFNAVVEENLYAVPTSTLPAWPASVDVSGLTSAEVGYLRGLHLASLGNGEWFYEGVQYAAHATADLPAAARWVKRLEEDK